MRTRQTAAVTEAREINRLQAERELTEAEKTKLAELRGEIDRLQGAIETEERMNAVQASGGGAVAAPVIGMSETEVRQFSLLRAIRAQATGDWRTAGLEREASDATAKRIGREPSGFFLPYDWLRSGHSGVEQRAITTTTGANLIPTQKLGFIDVLRNRMMVRAAGAVVLDGLIGNVDLPARTAGAALSWVAAGAAPGSEGTQTFGAVQLRAKTGSAYIDVYRTMFNQTSLDLEMLVRDDLAAAVQLGIDWAALHGSGSSNEPTGIAATAGIGSVAGGTNGLAPTWAHIVALETEVAIDNADVGRLGYMTNPKVRGKLKSTVVGTDQRMIWAVDAGETPLNGYPAWITNQVSSALTKGSSSGVCSAIFFANWAELVIGLWGVIDVTADIPDNRTGTVRVAAIVETDIGVRHAQSFAAMLDALTT